MKTINTELGIQTDKHTQTIWVVATFTTESSSIDWFYVKAIAEAYYQDQKVINHPSQELSQAHLFAFEATDGMPNDDITDVIDNFYDNYATKPEFYENENVKGFPFTSDGWKFIIENHMS